jgi:hypothetical protein
MVIRIRRTVSRQASYFRSHRAVSHRRFAAHGPLHKHEEAFDKHIQQKALWRKLGAAPKLATRPAGPAPKFKAFPGGATAKYKWKTPKPAVAVKPLKMPKPKTPAQILAEGKKKTGKTARWSVPKG